MGRGAIAASIAKPLCDRNYSKLVWCSLHKRVALWPRKNPMAIVRVHAEVGSRCATHTHARTHVHIWYVVVSYHAHFAASILYLTRPISKVARAKRAKNFQPETTPTIRKPHSQYSCQEAHTRLYRRIIDERERSERLYYQPLYDIFQV